MNKPRTRVGKAISWVVKHSKLKPLFLLKRQIEMSTEELNECIDFMDELLEAKATEIAAWPRKEDKRKKEIAKLIGKAGYLIHAIRLRKVPRGTESLFTEDFLNIEKIENPT